MAKYTEYGQISIYLHVVCVCQKIVEFKLQVCLKYLNLLVNMTVFICAFTGSVACYYCEVYGFV